MSYSISFPEEASVHLRFRIIRGCACRRIEWYSFYNQTEFKSFCIFYALLSWKCHVIKTTRRRRIRHHSPHLNPSLQETDQGSLLYGCKENMPTRRQAVGGKQVWDLFFRQVLFNRNLWGCQYGKRRKIRDTGFSDVLEHLQTHHSNRYQQHFRNNLVHCLIDKW